MEPEGPLRYDVRTYPTLENKSSAILYEGRTWSILWKGVKSVWQQDATESIRM
jgi:hypothetical protein